MGVEFIIKFKFYEYLDFFQIGFIVQNSYLCFPDPNFIFGVDGHQDYEICKFLGKIYFIFKFFPYCTSLNILELVEIC